MPTISESPIELNAWKFERVRSAFIAGTIGEATYQVSLEILGIRGQDASTEIWLAKQEIKRVITSADRATE